MAPVTGTGGWCVAIGTWHVVRGSAGIEQARRCSSGETRRAITYAPGVVSDPGADDGDVRVRTDDGRSSFP
jgi:hypothetical protein